MKPIGRTLNITGFPQEAFVVLADIATTMGLSPGQMACRVLVESLENYGAPEWFKTFADLFSKSIVTDWFFNQIHQAIVNNNEDKLSKLLENAKGMSLDADDLFLRASELSSHEVSGSQKINDAAQLITQMVSAQESVRAAEILNAARQAGFSSYAVGQAKQIVGVVSKRNGRYWVWELPGKKD